MASLSTQVIILEYSHIKPLTLLPINMFSKLKRIISMVTKSNNHNVQENSLYQLIGGESGTRNLAEAFYDEMETNIHLQELLAIHKQPLDNIRQKFFEFLSGWLGGPRLFEQKYGHPQLRARHMPFQVTKKQRDLWMLCMNNSMKKVIDDKEIEQHLRQAFDQMASHMVNC